VTSRRPADGREVLGHVALALSRYLRESRGDGVWVPPEVESLAVLLADCARQRQEATTFAPCGEGPDDEVMKTTLLLTRREAAHVLRRSVRSVDRAVAAGVLPAVKVEGSTRIRRADIEAYVDSLQPPRSFRDQVTAKDGAA